MRQIGQMKMFLLLTALFALPLLSSHAHAMLVSIGPEQFAADATLIDFELGGPPITTSDPDILSLVLPPGVKILETQPTNVPGWLSAALFGSTAMFGQELLANTVSLRYSDIGIQFPTTHHAVGAWVACLGGFTGQCPTRLSVAVFDGSSNLLGTNEITLPPSHKPVFLGFATDVGIGKIEWLGGNAGFFGVDDVLYGNAVPEPSTWAMLALGTLWLGWIARRTNMS